MLIVTVYLLLGTLAGLLAGLLGIGGGIVVVPVLYFVFQSQYLPAELLMHMAVGSSLATVVCTSITSAYAHHRRGAVLWDVVKRLAPGIVVGAWMGAAIAGYLPSDGLRVFFGLFEVYIAVQLLFGFKPAPHRTLPEVTGMTAVGGGIGAISSILGIGGGTLTVPFLLWCNIGIREAVATSAACGFPIALAGAAGFVVTGWAEPRLPAWSSGYVYWPAVLGVVMGSVLSAPWGVRLAHTLPVATLKRLFAIIVVLIGIRMLL
jgi:uncharacterized membrane protein YfcA